MTILMQNTIIAPSGYQEKIENFFASVKESPFSDLHIFWYQKYMSLEIELVCPYGGHCAAFILQMLRYQLILGTELTIANISSCRFSMREEQTKWCFFSATIDVQNEKEIDKILRRKEAFVQELHIGLSGENEAQQVLGFSQIGMDHNSHLIEQKIARLIRGHSKDFGIKIIAFMRRFLVSIPADFMHCREPLHISRVISTLFVMQKLLEQKQRKSPHARHQMVKFLQNTLNIPSNKQTVLSVIFSLTLKEHEIFEKKHLLLAIQKIFPNVLDIPGSYYMEKMGKNSVLLMYLEIKKQEGFFTEKEVQKLRLHLPNIAIGEIEKLIHPVFMPRNEEDIIKNITALADELKYVDDIPQVIIHFDQQTDREIGFSVILARILKPNLPPLENILHAKKTVAKFFMERTRQIGKVRKKYPKEVHVFQLRLPAAPYLREDHSLDIHKARQDAYTELLRLFHDLRDYNGGMIFKQNQTFAMIKRALADFVVGKEIFLEKMFYSVKPVEALFRYKTEMQKLFLLTFDLHKKALHTSPIVTMYNEAAYVVFSYPSFGAFPQKLEEFQKITQSYLHALIFFETSFLDITYVGYIIFAEQLLHIRPKMEALGLHIS